MERIEVQSKPGYYTVYSDSREQTYLVLEGLDPSKIHTPLAVEKFLLEQISIITIVYWCAFILTLGYLIVTYILVPIFGHRNVLEQ